MYQNNDRGKGHHSYHKPHHVSDTTKKFQEHVEIDLSVK